MGPEPNYLGQQKLEILYIPVLHFVIVLWMFINFVVIWVCSLSCFVIVCHLGGFFLSLFDHFGMPQKPGFKKT